MSGVGDALICYAADAADLVVGGSLFQLLGRCGRVVGDSALRLKHGSGREALVVIIYMLLHVEKGKRKNNRAMGGETHHMRPMRPIC